jgi:GNAT superfamily N-acetyltransferase
MRIRRATRDDAETLAALLRDCLRESYPGHPGSTPEQLRRDVLSGASSHHVLLAEKAVRPTGVDGHESAGPTAVAAIGFVAWDAVHDMHWATPGAQVADLYVAPGHRGIGTALALLAGAAAEVRSAGGAFLRGGAYDRESTRRFYSRFAVITPNGETHLSGRAFHRIADLAGLTMHEMIARLPPVEWNFEA